MAGETKEDRRSVYTRKVIKEAFFESLQDKGRFDAVTITDICKRADINRSTFYLHYEDKYDLLRKLIIEELSNDSETLALIETPLCQRLPSNPLMQKLFRDPSLASLIAECIIDVRSEEVVPDLMSRCGLSEDEARYLFTFSVNGSLAVSRALDWKRNELWKDAQSVIAEFVQGGEQTLSEGEYQ